MLPGGRVAGAAIAYITSGQTVNAVDASIVGNVARHGGADRRKPPLTGHGVHVAQRPHADSGDRQALRIEEDAGDDGTARKRQGQVGERLPLGERDRRTDPSWPPCAIVDGDVPLFRPPDRVSARAEPLERKTSGIIADGGSGHFVVRTVQEHSDASQRTRVGVVGEHESRDRCGPRHGLAGQIPSGWLGRARRREQEYETDR